ncbi:DUF6624 domain-containing protein [Ascidiimonas aurantiaca]|uniref:DUF6624 domain-containing protein n=1 Tax=Ascidiimonas aurantiaca TaxID=1685432 RepID=UPI0030EC5675
MKLSLAVIVFLNLSILMAQNPLTAEQSRRKGETILENTLDILSKTKDTTYADHWNLAMAYSLLGNDKTLIRYNLEKSKEMNTQKFMNITNYFIEAYNGIENTVFYQVLGQEYLTIIKGYNLPKEIPASSRNSPEYYTINQDTSKNFKVITKLITLMKQDQFYRSHASFLNDPNKIEKQRILDEKNTQELKQIFNTYGYPGKSLVGEKYCNYASIIIEHTEDICFLEKWFPVIAEAFKNKEIDNQAFKLLADRYHWRKTNKQIFGTHAGIMLDSAEVIKEFKIAHNLHP